MKICTSIALKLHAFGVTQLHDPNWTGMELFDRLKQHTRGRVEPTSLLFKTLQKGLLYHIGLWLYEDYIISDVHRMSLGGEYRLWYLEDLLELLQSASVPQDDTLVAKARRLVEKVDALYAADEAAYFEAVDRNTLFAMTDRLIQKFENEIMIVAGYYARNYAERVFHDRQLCEHVSKTLVLIGFDGQDDDGPPKQWIDRQRRWPAWALKAVTARDRGHCALCGSGITLELEASPHIDHIVALAKGGTNDLCNLQLLCDVCNRKKAARRVAAKSSVPEYLQLAAERRHKRDDG